MNRSRNLVILVALILAVFAMPASAQVYMGRIDVTAVDSTGAVLPGVSVEISGPQNATQVTDATHAPALQSSTIPLIRTLGGSYEVTRVFLVPRFAPVDRERAGAAVCAA